MTAIELFEIPLGLFTFRARRAGPSDGRPVILLHGVPQTSLCWEAQLTALGDAGYHAVAFDQRGYSPGARSEDIAEFTMDKIGGRRARDRRRTRLRSVRRRRSRHGCRRGVEAGRPPPGPLEHADRNFGSQHKRLLRRLSRQDSPSRRRR